MLNLVTNMFTDISAIYTKLSKHLRASLLFLLQ